MNSWALCRAFVRGRGLAPTAAYLLASAIAVWWATDMLIAAPLSDHHTVMNLAWASCLPAVIAVPALSSPNAELERTYPQNRIGIIRLSWLGILSLTAPALFALQIALFGGQMWMLAWFTRNHILILAIGALAILTITPRAAWALPAIYVLLCWFGGTIDAAANPTPWALPNYPPTAESVTTITVVAIAAAATGHYLKPNAPDR